MHQRDTITVVVDHTLPEGERESLLLTLRDHADIDEARPRELITAVTVFVLVMKDVGTVAGGATAVLTLAEKIRAWRDGVRARNIKPPVRLERPGHAPLDLAAASDAEVLAWFRDTPPAH